MKKNYLLFIIDSLNNSHVKESPIELMPFWGKLKAEGIFCDDMFSQAPYTEAAVMNLYCGQDILQDGGYLFRFKNAKSTIFEEMQKAGYITYYNSYQPQCHPSSVRRGIDHLYYNVGYDQGALWSYRMQHYSEQFKAGNLTDKDYETLREIFEDNFESWLRFIDDFLAGDESTNMIQDNAPDYEPNEVRKMVSAEYEAYKKSPEDYIREILTTGPSHKFFQIPAYTQTGKIKDRAIVEQIRQEFRPLFKRIRAMDFRLNLRNNRELLINPIKKFFALLKHPGKTAYNEFLRSGYLLVNGLIDFDLFQRIDMGCDRFKNAPSGRTHIDHYLNWAREHKDDGPHFACVHIDDIHNPEIFFTYDSADMALLRKEKAAAEALLDEIPKTYHGSLTHDLSLRYIDNVIKYLYEELEKEGLLENTCIAICSDHGFSFSGNPVRDSFVTNLYLENYNIACSFTGTGLEHESVSALRASKDVPATLCALAAGSVPEAFSGHSLTEKYEYDEVHIEYCGGGCPDLSRRELKLAAFDKTYFVGTLCTLDAPLEGDAVTEIYDLTADPKQLHNLIHKEYDREKVEALLKTIEARRREIQRTRI